jgi:alkaline phosphatase D
MLNVTSRFLFLALLLFSSNYSCASNEISQNNQTKKPVVIWLSIDGLKSTYLNQAVTPNFDSLKKNSIVSSQLTPIFPSLTFPSHCSQATGVKVAEHGITSNAFYDSKLKQTLRYPNDAEYLEAEAIWNTAKRQGLRTAVFDWPLSHNQKGPHAADHFNPRYQGELTDRERIEKLLNIWEKDSKENQEKLSLVMAYIVGPDSIGHEHGPNDARVLKKVEEVDELIGYLKKRIMEISDKYYGKNYNIHLMITTDHGMAQVEKGVNLRLLSKLPTNHDLTLITGGNVGHIFLDNVKSTRERRRMITNFKKEYQKYSFVQAYERKDLPAQWNYAHPNRVGDLVVILDQGHTFTAAARQPIVDIKETNGPFGMHGYDPSDDPNMKGTFILWRYPELKKAKNISGAIHSLQLHPTVSSLLGIEASNAAKAKKIDCDGSPCL